MMRRARLVLGHAAVQRTAEAAGVDLLHIKGYALDPSLTWPERASTDVDVLVRPAHLGRMIDALTEAGWTERCGFAARPPFEHAARFAHPEWGQLDLHRIFPGVTVDPDTAFRKLWRDRGELTLAGWRCPVPSLEGQSLVLVLHAARSGGDACRDVERAWEKASPRRQRAIRDLVADLGAEVAFAAAVGGLGAYSGRRDYELWRVLSHGGTPMDQWRARLAAAPTWRHWMRLALQAPLLSLCDGAARSDRPAPSRWCRCRSRAEEAA